MALMEEYGSIRLETCTRSVRLLPIEIWKILIPKMGFLGYLQIPPRFLPVFQAFRVLQAKDNKSSLRSRYIWQFHDGCF
jgi:hypothetical protein